MGDVIQFPARELPSTFRLDDVRYRAYCSLHDEVQRLLGLPYRHRKEHARAYGELLARGECERELDRLRKIVNPTGRLRGT